RDAISFLADTVDTNYKVNIDLIINNRRITQRDTAYSEPYKQYTINKVNIYPDFGFATANDTITATNTYRDYNVYTYGELNYGLRSLTSFVFFKPGDLYTDRDRNFTVNRINSLGLFRYPNVEYVPDPEDSTETGLIANILLTPVKKFRLSAGLDATHNNIQTIGLGLQTSLIWRNPLKSAGIFDIGIRGNIGSSKNAAEADDPFFDITELGVTANFTLPGVLFPAKTEQIIPKYMTPFTRINSGVSLQENIGLDRRSINGALQYLWKPKSNLSTQLDLLNLQFIRNLNPERYFTVFVSSFDRLNAIAQRSNYIPSNENLDPIEEADVFIDDVLAGNVPSISEEDFISVNNIRERQERISQNNLIASGSFSWLKDTRETLFDRSFHLIRYRLELAGNLLSLLSEGLGGDTDSNGDKQLFGVTYSQYIKGEAEYVKHWEISDDESFGIRLFAGLAVPYGNSNSIPFIRSFFAGGSNDNRAWRPYALGPGSSGSIDEFNEANLKLSLNAEYRYKILGALNGAFFIDAGNVWNVFDNVEEEGAVFTGIDSLKDLGVGSGFGLRYDFNYFVIRFDVGFKTYNPALPEGDRWFKEFNFGNAVYNFGINYP
ncbi:MAG: BamA/TamA family outer membrane protein, partial [Flavobacteriaceae bacterium]|nr:BamA/TamA family outer membrane protein [Flavobacteriaceae bacterium]